MGTLEHVGDADVLSWNIRNISDRKDLLRQIQDLIDDGGAMDSDAEEVKEEEEEWARMDEIEIPYEEEKTTIQIKVAVGTIAKTVTSTVAAMASSGALSPVLMKSLSDCVVTAGWTQECSKQKV